MDEDKRATALNSITTVGKEYISLSDGTKIGKKVLKDLKKLMELELREKYKIVKNKWKVVSDKDKENTKNLIENGGYNEIKDETKLTKRITEKYNSNKEKIEKINSQIEDIKKSNIEYNDDNLFNELTKKRKELEELVEIDYITKDKISFNSIVNDNDVLFLPYIVINDDPKDIAIIINDKKELDKIFREKHFKSFDDSVILDFYNEITTKLSDTKDFIRKTDVNIRKDIIEDLYKKLFAVYDIKDNNFKDKKDYTKKIKDIYINKKIKQNNSLSFGGSQGGFLKDTMRATTTIVKATGKTMISAPLAAAKAVTRGAIRGKNNVVKVGKKVKASIPMPIVSIAKVIENREKKRKEFTDADKFVMALFENDDVSPDNLNIDLLTNLVNHLDKNSRYKKDIEALIGFNQAILKENENTKESEATKKSNEKNTTSNEFITKALDKYKKLKKSFMDKVANDKKELDEELQEGAHINFIKDAKFNDIVEADNIYIENVKDLYSYLQIIDKQPNTGGAAPLYDIKKTEKIEDKEIGATPYDFFKILKNNYIEIVTLYYKLIDDSGNEEKHYKFIYKYDGIEEPSNDEDTSNKIDDSDVTQNTKFKKRVAALEFIKNNLTKYLPESVKPTNIINKSTPYDAQYLFFKELCEKSNVGFVVSQDITQDIKALQQIFSDILVHDIQSKKEIFEDSLLGQVNTSLLSKNVGVRWQEAMDKNENLKIAIGLIAKDTLQGKELVDELTLKLNPEAKDEIERNKASNEATELINELKEKIRLLESRISVLSAIELKLPAEFKKLYKTITKMKTIPQSTEYEDFIINILKRYKINFFEKEKEIDKHPIIKMIKSEKAQVEDKLKKLKSEVAEQEKERKAQVDILKAQGRGYGTARVDGKTNGGGAINSNKLKKDLKIDTTNLISKHKDYEHFIIHDDDNNNNNLQYFMEELKTNIEHLENDDSLDNSVGNNKNDTGREKGIYEDIWYDYNYAVNKPNNKNDDKFMNDLLFLTEGEKLHERVIENDLDPEIVLKINFQDKAIYIFLMFLIRTINIITLEFFIEYNLIRSLQYAIVFYGFIYLVIIIFLIAIVNYDSYKLRILFNYLNIHINAPNILLQNVLFIIFIILVYILVKSDDFLKYFGDLLDYTKIYNNIYNYTNLLDDDYYTNLTQNEKLKLLYRIDIISMIIFIFSAFLVLIL